MGRTVTGPDLAGAAPVPTVAAVPPGVLAAVVVVAVLALALVAVLVVRGRSAAEDVARARDRERVLAARLDALGDLAGAGVLVQSADGRVLEIDDRAAGALGLEASTAVGRPVADLPVALVDDAGGRVHPGAVLGAPVRHGGHSGQGGRRAVVVGVTEGGHAAVRRVRVESLPLPAAPGGGGVLTVVTPVDGAGGDRSGVALHDAAQAAPVAIALARPDGRVVEANRAFAELAGAGLDARPDIDLGDAGRRAGGDGWADAVARLGSGAGCRVTVEQRWSRGDGRDAEAAVVLDLALVAATAGSSARVAVVARDVTADRLRSDALTHRALHDPLTGLANRALLLETLHALLGPTGAAERVAVLACDLDGFKPINDRYGHAAGDDVLVHVAAVLRAATGGAGTVARLGGDEFVVVLQAPDSALAAQRVAGAIHAGLREPVLIQRHRVAVRASVGVALGSSPLPSQGAPGLLAAADAALYRAKGAGRSRTEVYDPALDHDGAPAGLAAELAGALERGELVVHLQPVVDLADGRVAGERAHVRWAHPARGLLSSSAFAPAVREAGLSAPVTRHVLACVVDHLARTAATGRWVAAVVEAEVLDAGLARAVLDDLAHRGVDRGRLVLALDGVTGDVVHRVRGHLGDLRGAGVPVLLHRFGAGPPPLTALRDLPVDGVVLDPSFASGVVDDPGAARVAGAVGALCRELGLLTVADGVDGPEQAQVLAGAGWRYASGWAFGGPQAPHAPQRPLVPQSPPGPPPPGSPTGPAVR